MTNPETPTARAGDDLTVARKYLTDVWAEMTVGWGHLPDCACFADPMTIECDCTPERYAAAVDRLIAAALRRADEPRVTEGLTDALADAQTEADMANAYYPTLERHLRQHGCDHDFADIADANGTLPAPRPPEPRCSECGVLIAEHPPTDACAIAQESRPPEPDRTAALVEALVAAVDRWNHVRNEVAPARWSRVHDLRAVDEALIAANEAVRVALATHEPAPVADGHALTNDCIGGGCTECETEPPAGIEP